MNSEIAQLLTQAIEFISQSRDELFRSFEIDCVIDDPDIAAEVARMDEWLRKAKECAA